VHNGIAATVLALTIIGVVFGTIVQAEDPASSRPAESEREWQSTMERTLAQVERGLRQMAGTRPAQ